MFKTKREAIDFCLTFKDVYEDYPFKDTSWAVIRCKPNRKIFAWIFERYGNVWINLKAAPEMRDFWRSAFGSVLPAYHLNKEHWNSVILDGSIPESDIKEMISHSYHLIYKPAAITKRKASEK